MLTLNSSLSDPLRTPHFPVLGVLELKRRFLQSFDSKKELTITKDIFLSEYPSMQLVDSRASLWRIVSMQKRRVSGRWWSPSDWLDPTYELSLCLDKTGQMGLAELKHLILNCIDDDPDYYQARMDWRDLAEGVRYARDPKSAIAAFADWQKGRGAFAPEKE